MQERALVLAERGEEVVLDPARERTQAPERPLPFRSETNGVAAAVVRIAPALDEVPLLELVEQPDELPAVVPERVGDGTLRLARALGEDEQDGVVVGVEARPLVRLHRLL